ncbi:MAG: hypothetical protein M5U34_15330 [Chloroflexi bacterium]|nr:hypothetical protein [Chloroflexota bacterium]
MSHLHCCGITPSPITRRLPRRRSARKSRWAGQRVAMGWKRPFPSNNVVINCWPWNVPPPPSCSQTSQINAAEPVVLVVGNEIAGVDPGILAICDQTIMLPMQGVKNSLNVASAFAVAAYALRFSL